MRNLILVLLLAGCQHTNTPVPRMPSLLPVPKAQEAPQPPPPKVGAPMWSFFLLTGLATAGCGLSIFSHLKSKKQNEETEQ